jgi:hypothetical protein
MAAPPPARPRVAVQEGVKRADKANTIDLFVGGEVLEGG